MDTTLGRGQTNSQSECPRPGVLHIGDKPPCLLGNPLKQVEWLEKPRLYSQECSLPFVPRRKPVPSLGEKTVLDGCAGQRGGIWPVVSSGLEQGSRVVLCCDLIIHRRLCTSQPHSSTLAWKIPWTEEAGRLQSMGVYLRMLRADSSAACCYCFADLPPSQQGAPLF